MTNSDVIIIGGGAAGLMCAIEAGKRGRRVLVLEHAEQIAGKIRISGGGRCNFTNLETRPDNYLSQNPHFCRSALKRYSPQDFIALIERHDIRWHEKKSGQLFCDGKSREIIDMLIRECEAAQVDIHCATEVGDIEQLPEGFKLYTDRGDYTCSSLVMASGGKSIPKMGASGFGYEIARKFGHEIIPPEPALVPFTFQNELRDQFKSLSGISLEVELRLGKFTTREDMLFTHRGLSGPAILQMSSHWQPGNEIRLNLWPEGNMLDHLKEQRIQHPRLELHNVLSVLFARRLAQFICDQAGTCGRLADLSNKKLDRVARMIHDWRIKPNGTEGFRTAEVTRGGVDTAEISSKTFESARCPGLYFIGEVLDVTGALGGYNFQWAWASGHAAGQVV